MFLALAAALIQSSWSVQTVSLLTLEEPGSLSKVRSHSVLMTLYFLLHIMLWLFPICYSCAFFQRPCLVELQEAYTFFQNFLLADFTAASSVSNHLHLLTQDWSWWCSPMSQFLTQTHHHSGWHCTCSDPWQSLHLDLPYSQSPPQPQCCQSQHNPCLDHGGWWAWAGQGWG